MTITDAQFGTAYTLGFKRTCNWLKRRGLSPDKAEEAAQDGWTRAWERRDSYAGRCSINTWVHVITWNQYLDRIRRSKEAISQSIDQMNMSDDRQEYAKRDLLLLHHDRTDERILAHQLTIDLPSIDIQYLTLIYTHGYTTQEAADILGRNCNTMKVRFHRVVTQYSSDK